MAVPIDFYFDFSSPYGYLASLRIDELAARHGRDVVWRPFLLGVVFKITGQSPLPDQPLRGVYARRDIDRFARLIGAPFRFPTSFPMLALAASRAYYWLLDRDPAQAKALARAIFHAYFADGRDVGTPEAVAREAEKIGADGSALRAALQDPAVKERLRRETEAAIDRGVFGSPIIFVDDEPFWGADRLEQVERWLDTGGW